MSINLRSSPIMLAALAAAASMGVMPQSAEVVPRPEGLGGWITRNNRRRKETQGAFGVPKAKQRRQRLQRATGPGSYDEWKAELAAARAAKRAEINGPEQHGS